MTTCHFQWYNIETQTRRPRPDISNTLGCEQAFLIFLCNPQQVWIIGTNLSNPNSRLKAYFIDKLLICIYLAGNELTATDSHSNSNSKNLNPVEIENYALVYVIAQCVDYKEHKRLYPQPPLVPTVIVMVSPYIHPLWIILPFQLSDFSLKFGEKIHIIMKQITIKKRAGA